MYMAMGSFSCLNCSVADPKRKLAVVIVVTRETVDLNIGSAFVKPRCLCGKLFDHVQETNLFCGRGASI
jgi:hypothetical protein